MNLITSPITHCQSNYTANGINFRNYVYPLDYFPIFADGSNMAEIPANIHKFSYLAATNPAGVNPAPAYIWTDISATGIDVTSHLSTNEDRSYQVNLGFEFPFFGRNETSIYISLYSTLSFDTEGYVGSVTPLRYQWEGLPDRLISVTRGPDTFRKWRTCLLPAVPRINILFSRKMYLCLVWDWEATRLFCTTTAT